MRLLALTVTITALIAAPASAAPAVDGVFDIPGAAGVTTNGQLTVGPDGNVWVALDTAIAKVTPDGTVTVFASADLNNALGTPEGGITSADGFIWVGQAPNGGKKALVKIPPANPAAAEGVDVTGLDAGARALSLGPDGRIWAAQNGKVVRFSSASPATAVAFLFGGLQPRGMAWAGDGSLWVSDVGNGGQLLNVSAAGLGTPHPTGGGPQGVAAGPNGQIAFANPNSAPQQIGLLTSAGTQLLSRPNGSDPFGVTFGNDGAYWVAEFAGNRLARVTTDGQLTTLTGFPDAPLGTQGPRQITTGPNNTLWATLDKPGDAPNSKIVRITGVEPPPPPSPPVEQPPAEQPPVNTPPPPDKTAPVITNVSLTKTRTGVQLTFTLSEPGTMKIDVSRAARGQRHGKSCLKPNARRKKAKRCTRWVRVRALGGNGGTGQNRIQLNTRKFRAGRYRVVFTATDAAGNRSKPVTRRFTIRR